MAEHYVTEEEAKNAYRLAQEGDPNELARVALLIAESIFRMIHGGGDNEDALQDAVAVVLAKASNYRPDKGKAFAYITTTIRHALSKSVRAEAAARDRLGRYRADLIRESQGY